MSALSENPTVEHVSNLETEVLEQFSKALQFQIQSHELVKNMEKLALDRDVEALALLGMDQNSDSKSHEKSLILCFQNLKNTLNLLSTQFDLHWTKSITYLQSIMLEYNKLSKNLICSLEQLEHLSTHDPLTNAYNRRYFINYLQSEMPRSKRYKLEFTVLAIDIDNFKNINDSFGHLIGDAALQHLTKVITETLRTSDIIARTGGDEFAIILLEANLANGLLVAKHIQEALKVKPFMDSEKNSHELKISIGAIAFPENADNEHDLLAKVDDALYEAKKMGKDSIVAAS